MPMQTETLTPATDASEIPKLVAKLRDAFESGRTRPIEWRRRQLQRMKAMLQERSESDAVQERVLEQTSSGGACVNATVLHVAVPDLPFGGVGASGMGAYHGKAGFDVFSHRKSVLMKPTRLDPKLAYPPYTKLKERIIRRFL